MTTNCEQDQQIPRTTFRHCAHKERSPSPRSLGHCSFDEGALGLPPLAVKLNRLGISIESLAFASFLCSDGSTICIDRKRPTVTGVLAASEYRNHSQLPRQGGQGESPRTEEMSVETLHQLDFHALEASKIVGRRFLEETSGVKAGEQDNT
ncbi:hypothetical protein BaRGS_00005517 [Batillaria attramentaria]|uniref:Uncharacterized protein n=1 Tax=Batillaria attramentaria TaxID=370345 RepID=A0ABD0LUT1_9CAEN